MIKKIYTKSYIQSEGNIGFSYYKLSKLLIYKNTKKKDLIDRTGISPTIISKIVRGYAVSLTIIGKICEELGTDIGDLICIEKNDLEDK